MLPPSTKPYFIRAIHEWCSDNAYTPYLGVLADEHARIPREFVREGQIVLNISHDATGHLSLGNEHITFQARFGGVARDIFIPIGNVISIHAKESAEGMSFAPSHEGRVDAGEAQHNHDEEPPPPPAGRPKLPRVK